MNKIYLLIPFFFLPVLVKAQAPTDTANIYVDTTGQRDLLDVANKVFKFKPRKYPKSGRQQIYFSVLPISTSVPGGSKALVTSTTAGFYLGPRRTTYISSVTFAPYFNLKGRYGLPVHSSVWLRDNGYNIQGDTRFLVYPQNTWGLGGGQPKNADVLVNFDYVRFYQDVLKRITPFFYAGVGFDLDYYSNVQAAGPVSLGDFTGYQYGVGPHSFSDAITFNLLYDSRQNIFNPIPGIYGNIIYRHDAGVLGSGDNAASVYIDFRKYISLNDIGKKNQLAFWTYYWTTLSAGTPYLNLPGVGMDPYQRSGRGIQQDRDRGNEFIYFETEYRRDITRNGLLGFVLFGNVNSATQGNTREFAYLTPAAGAGLRLKYNKKSNTNICLDYGVSKDYWNITVALGETF